MPTKCDKFGGRWRVAVPDVGTCTGGKPPAPVRGRDCSFSCPPGTFLHLQSQNCQSCPAGTYSLGGGIRYDDFLNLPKGFRIVNEISSAVSIQTSLIDSNDKVGNVDDPSFSCNGTGWQIRGGTLTYIPSPCLSTLLYNVKLVRPGFVRYKYIYPDSGVFLSFHVSLSSGPILLSWKALVLHGQHRPIVIKSIEIRVLPIQEFASPVNRAHIPMQVLLRAPNVTNYLNIQATINYRWSEPKICRSDLAGAVQLPESQLNVKCPPCNPGTFLRGGRCRICPKNYFSSGNEANTQPDYQYSFIWWNELPENVTSTCQTLEGNTCDGSESWLPLGDRISTSHSRRDDVYLSLILEVAGFRSTANNDAQTPVGVVTFVFQTQCIGDCAFFFVEWIFVRSQLSTEERMQNRDVSFDEASLYVINVTNTINGEEYKILNGFSIFQRCLPCPPGHFIVNESGSCAPCPAGTFLNTSNNVGPEACIPCGPNLQSRKGVECVANCKLQFDDKQYDLSPLNGSCANGYYAILTFRCDPASNSSKISLPSTCPDGTCDGCLYQVVITSRFACPICSAEDYKEIVGECVNNLQTIHRIPAKHCILIGQDHTESTVVSCQSISVQVQLIIAVATAVIVFLFITVLLIRKKNQKLQYKYMKLVQSASGKDAELPGAESCALTEDEDDTASASDRILFVHGKGKSRTSGWLTLDRKSTTENGYESTALTAASD
ncbi:conserved hypothetical protein [Trichinella spiralis]|uniref:hypothetical protein n=1 Tax=Trichinella spiralis TaxID=6334 RepID=UPI0001EFC739|nr:conserved hypothetical protein [Trichinella spiralis]